MTENTVTTNGIKRVWDPRVWGAIIGGVGGSLFIHINSQTFSGEAKLFVISAWLLLLAYMIYAVFFRMRRFSAMPLPHKFTGPIYTASIIGMFLLFRLGSQVLLSLNHIDLMPALAGAIVGLHFLPMAYATASKSLYALSLSMTIIGMIGVAGGLMFGTTFGLIGAVATGFAMMSVLTLDAVRPFGFARA